MRGGALLLSFVAGATTFLGFLISWSRGPNLEALISSTGVALSCGVAWSWKTRRQMISRWEGVGVAVVSSVLGHYLPIWVFFVCMWVCYIVSGSCVTISGPPANPLLLVFSALLFGTSNLIAFGWCTLPVIGICGYLIAEPRTT